MNNPLKKMALVSGLAVLFFFLLFIINQTAQVVQLAHTLDPLLARIVFWGLLILYALLVSVPVFLFLRLPRPLRPPQKEDSPEFEVYLKALKKRLVANPLLKDLQISNRQEIEKALAVLEGKAEEIIRQTALSVFISTAISQSGRLDAFLVLTAQSRLIWRIARLYYQRPTPRDFIYLYSNIAGTVFLSSELEDFDLSEQVEPVLSSTLGALAVTIPGVQLAASILVNSVLTGSANAFLTLRVGILTKRYCGSLVRLEKPALRRMASAQAAKLLGSIVKQGTGRITKALLKASQGKMNHLFAGLKGFTKGAGRSLLTSAGLQQKKEPLDGETGVNDQQTPTKDF